MSELQNLSSRVNPASGVQSAEGSYDLPPISQDYRYIDSISPIEIESDPHPLVYMWRAVKWLFMTLYDCIFMCFPSSNRTAEELALEKDAKDIFPSLIEKWQPRSVTLTGAEDAATLKAWFSTIEQTGPTDFQIILQAFFVCQKPLEELTAEQFVDEHVRKLEHPREMKLPKHLCLPYGLSRWDMTKDLKVLSLTARQKLAEKLAYTSQVETIAEENDPFVETCFLSRSKFCESLNALLTEILEG